MEEDKKSAVGNEPNRNTLVDILNKAMGMYMEQFTMAINSREAFKEYCRKQEKFGEQCGLIQDLQEANPNALDNYYDERVREDEHYMSCDDVDSNYVRRDEITTEWLGDNQGDSFMEECSNDYLSHINDEDTFVEHIMRHLTRDSAAALVRAIVNEYL